MPEKKEYALADPRCINRVNFIDECTCVCPYCGETAKCICCIGIDKAAGGG